MRIPFDANPFEVLLAQIGETIKIEEDYVRRFARHRRRDFRLAVALFAIGAAIAYFGNWLGWVYLVLGAGMVGMGLHAQFCLLRTEKWLEGWRADLALFQLGAIEWDNGEFPEWVIREAEASGRYYFSQS